MHGVRAPCVRVRACAADGHRRGASQYSCKYFWQFDKIHTCFDMVREHESRHGFEYDWLVRLRPDVRFDAAPDVARLCRANASHVAHLLTLRPNPPPRRMRATLSDQFARMRRGEADLYFGAVRAFDWCVPLAKMDGNCHNHLKAGEAVFEECLLTYHYLSRQRGDGSLQLKAPVGVFSNLHAEQVRHAPPHEGIDFVNGTFNNADGTSRPFAFVLRDVRLVAAAPHPRAVRR